MLEKVSKVLVDAINVDESLIKPEASLKDDLGIDSLAAVELAMELESEFGIRIEDDILVTEDGSYNLSNSIIKEVNDIEKALKFR